MDKPTASNGQQNKKIEEQEEKEERNLSILDATSKKIPTLIEIQTFAEQEGLCVDVQKFYDYYTETGEKSAAHYQLEKHPALLESVRGNTPQKSKTRRVTL